MSTDQNLLTAAPLAFLLILPVLSYYCMRVLLSTTEFQCGHSAIDIRIPDYLMKQQVETSRCVRKKYQQQKKKQQKPKKQLKNTLKSNKSTEKLVFIQNLGKCAVGLQTYSLINSQLDQKYNIKIWESRTNFRLLRRVKKPFTFEPTKLTTIHQNVYY